MHTKFDNSPRSNERNEVSWKVMLLAGHVLFSVLPTGLVGDTVVYVWLVIEGLSGLVVGEAVDKVLKLESDGVDRNVLPDPDVPVNNVCPGISGESIRPFDRTSVG